VARLSEYTIQGRGCNHATRAYANLRTMPPLLHEIDPGPECPEIVRMIVEIPKNSGNKYEYDHKLGVFRLDRTLYSPMHYPGDYGFISGTLAHDGDPVDVDQPSFSGCPIEVRWRC
jgi:inorganic pyrophosphatase